MVEHEYLANISVKLEQRKFVAHTLNHEPFLVTSASFELENITDEQLREHMPVVEIAAEEDREVQDELEEEQTRFLQSIKEEPFLGRTERKRRLGLDSGAYAKVVSMLFEKGLIEKVNVYTGSGRPKVLYQLKGQNPSVKHQFYVYHLIRNLAERGIICRAQKIGPDIVIPQSKTAINVELGSSDYHGNILKALEDFERVIVCSDDVDLLGKISMKYSRVITALVWDVTILFENRIDKGRGEEIKADDSELKS